MKNQQLVQAMTVETVATADSYSPVGQVALAAHAPEAVSTYNALQMVQGLTPDTLHVAQLGSGPVKGSTPKNSNDNYYSNNCYRQQEWMQWHC